MPVLSLSDRIIAFLKLTSVTDPGQWVNGGEIERRALDIGYKASNASRRLRELYNEGKIERRENEKGHAEYRFMEREFIREEA